MLPPKYRQPAIISIILHAIVAILLVIEFTHPRETILSSAEPVEIIKAFSVESKALPKEKPAEPVKQEVIEEEPKITEQEIIEPKPENTPPPEQALEEKRETSKQLALKELEEKKLEEKKLEEKKLAEKKLAEKKLAEKKLAEKKLAEKKLAEKKLAEKKLAEKKLAEKKLAEKKRAAALAAKREAEAAEKAEAEAARISAVTDQAKAMIVAAIARQWIVPPDLDPNLMCRLAIRLGPGGVVVNVQVMVSSGDPILDRSAIAAVHKASPLPVPKESVVFNNLRLIHLTVRPEQVSFSG